MTLTRKTGELLLAAVIIARSTSFLFSKLVLQTIEPMTLMAIRFLLAFFFLAILFRKKISHLQKETLLRGMALGGCFFLVMVAELFALRITDASKVSFLENTAVVFVPLLEGILQKKCPRLPLLCNLLLTMVGIGLLTMQTGFSLTLQGGEPLALLAALLYACAIILTDRLSRQEDTLVLGILQVGFMGFFALLASFLLETPHLPTTTTEWGLILALSCICTGFGFTLQPVAQSYTTSERAGMFCALSPVSASLLGCLFLQEHFTSLGILGAVLVMSGILFSTVSKQTP